MKAINEQIYNGRDSIPFLHTDVVSETNGKGPGTVTGAETKKNVVNYSTVTAKYFFEIKPIALLAFTHIS